MKNRILVVDDNPGMIQHLGAALAGLADVRFATSGAAALDLMRQEAPDLVLLDAEMPGMSGFQVCETMQHDLALAHIPTIFVTSHSDPEFELKGFAIGAADFIAKPVSLPLLIARVRNQLRLKGLSDELKRVATIDPLTALANRGSLATAFDREWKRARRLDQPISVLMIDIDHFKLFNDCYGHPAGDNCIRAVADALRDNARRPADVVARFGGEEFVLLLPDTSRDGGEHVCYRVLDAIEALGIAHSASPSAHHVTVSVGLAWCEQPSAWPADESPAGIGGQRIAPAEALLSAADQALYAAKRSGRADARCLSAEHAGCVEYIAELQARNRLPEHASGTAPSRCDTATAAAAC